MTELHDAWLVRRRARWMRPNAHLYVRPDVHRFIRPGFDPLTVLSLLEGKANFNPDQPRVPKGNPDGGQWTSEGAGSVSEGENEGRAGNNPFNDGIDGDVDPDQAGNGSDDGELPTDLSDSRIRYRIVGLPEPTLGQLGRLVDANTRFDNAAQIIRQTDPAWRARTESLSDLNSNEGIIRHTEARALEAEAYARRLGIGGNSGPPLDPPAFGTSLPTMRPFNGPALIDAYRTLSNTTDLFGREVWSRDKGTVAVGELDGTPVFGINKEAPTYTSADLVAAQSMRDQMVAKYPGLSSGNIGQMPNDSLFHAEATILLRAARASGGNLNGKSLDVHVDRPLCWSCGEVLPKLGKELGNPIITYIHPSTGMRRTMWNGHWLD